MVYDTGILNRLGSKEKVIEYWKNAEPHLQARYCHASLGTKIKIERVAYKGIYEFAPINGHLEATEEMLRLLQEPTKFILGDADLVVYMANDVHNTYSGYSNLATVCANWAGSEKDKATINQWQYYPSRFGAVSTISIGIQIFYFLIFISPLFIDFGS